MNNDEIKIIESNGYKFISSTPDSHGERITIKHSLCGKEYTTRKSNFIIHGQRCTCQRKLSLNILDFVPDNYTLLSNFINRKREITLRHDICGHTYTIKRAEYLIDGTGRCPVCTSRTHNSKESLSKKFKNFNLELDIISDISIKDKTVLVHDRRCGHEYNIKYLEVINKKESICPYCRTKYRKNLDISYVKKEIENLDNNYTVLSDKYSDTHSYLSIRHNLCNTVYNVSRTNFLSGKRCPKCSGTSTSKEELEVLDFINIYDKASKKIFIDSNTLKKYEADIYVEDKSIGVEYNGLYWHSDNKREKNYHLNKTLFFKDRNIQIIHIFSDEWIYKKDIVKDKILAALGHIKKKIFARKCIVKPINSKTRNKFLCSNHIQGADSASISLGLFYQDELVAVMSFSKLRKSLGHKSKENNFELSRYAGKLGFSIVGGFSKLLKYAIKNNNINSIITYADVRFSNIDNNLYTANNFELDHISPPGYWYVNPTTKIREHRFKYRKQELKKIFPEIYDERKN